MADGSIRIDVGMDTSKATKELAKLERKIAETEKNLTQKRARRDELKGLMGSAYGELDAAKEWVNLLKDKVSTSKGDTKKLYQEDLADAREEQAAWNKEASKLNTEYDRVVKDLSDGERSLADMKSEAGALRSEIEAARPGEALAKGMDQAKTRMMQFLKYALGIRSVFMLFRKLISVTKESILAFAEHDAETKQSINDLRNALGTLKASWGAAFAPILNAVAPILQKFISMITSAINWVNKLISIISGKSSYKTAVANNNALADSYSAAGDAAAEAEKQLMGFDEINKLDAPNSGGGGGGGGAGDAISTIENLIDPGSFTARLGIAIKDILFNWDDLSLESILAKIITGLTALSGGLIGFTLGGIPGALIGIVLGAGLGMLLSSVIFDFNGALSGNEIAKSLMAILNMAVGGVIGFALGGPLGAAIGITIGAGLTFAIEAVKSKMSDKSVDILDTIVKTLTIVGGTAIGFAVGGPAGAAIGGRITLGLTLSIEKIGANSDSALNGFFQDLKANISQRIEENKDLGQPIAGAIINGFNQGLVDSIKGIRPGIKEKVIDPVIDFFKEHFGIHSPSTSTVFAEIGEFLIEGLTQGIGDKIQGVFDKFDELKKGISERLEDTKATAKSIIDSISGFFDTFHIQIPHFSIPHLEVTWEVSGSFLKFFGVDRVPHLNVAWYARGGIVDSPTLFGAGEAGKEAVIPLERNTEWINTVADGILQRLKNNGFAETLADAFIKTPMPAMAMGTVVPPNSSGGAFSSEWTNSILDEIKSLRSEISRLASQPIQVSSDMYLDKRKIGESVTAYQRENARSAGR